MKFLVRHRPGKKGVLFTAATIFLLLSVFLLAGSIADRNKGAQSLMNSGFGDKFAFMYDDIVSNSYYDLLEVIFEGLSRGATVTVKFDQLFASPARSYGVYADSYKTLVQGAYAAKQNAEIALTGMNTTFLIGPYNSTVAFEGPNISVYTMPTPVNYIESVTAYILINGTFSCNDAACPNQTIADEEGCQAANNDAGQPALTLTWEDSLGFTCTRSRTVDPTENNDKGNGKQFAATLLDGDVEVKYGEVLGIDGVFKLLSSGIEANMTQLDLEYTLAAEPVVLKGGIVSITSGNVTKRAEMILWSEK
ncbi:MAG TPA: hypothetical protein VJB08_00585 [Candidatus Nanoarchaeia archaeon]|nr:hypothetical protein [Candidatus Nanoarchaeia archaeon]